MTPCLTLPAVAPQKRIAFLFAHLHKGGMQKVASVLSCALPDTLEQYVVYFGTENPDFPYRATMVDMAVPGKQGLTFARKLSNFAQRLHRLQTFIDTHRIDTVVSMGEAANVLNCLTRRKRTVLSVHVSLTASLGAMGTIGAVYKQLLQRLYRCANTVVAVSEGLGSELREHYAVPAGKIVVIYNPFDLEQIRTLAKEPVSAEWERVFAHPTVVNVGSLTYQKGQEYLLRAFAHAKRRLPDLQLVIVGRGELQASLSALAEEQQVRASVHFTGFESNPFRYVARSRVFALTSRFEGFCMALVEAMICGVPVLSTDCKVGPGEILGDSKYGVLLPDITPANAAAVEQQVAESIIQLLNPTCAAHYRQQALLRANDFQLEQRLPEWIALL